MALLRTGERRAVFASEYRVHGKENRICFGVYPEVSLKAARELRDEARRLVSQGIDPTAHVEASKRVAVECAANDFETIAREWFSNLQTAGLKAIVSVTIDVVKHSDKCDERLFYPE